VVRSQLRAALSAGGKLPERDAHQPAIVESRVLTRSLPQVGKKPDFMQLAAVVALGVVVALLRPTHHK